MSRFLKFLRDRRGATALEFAFVGPIVIFAIVEISQAGLYVVQQTTIESATSRAARRIMVGGLDSGAADAAGFRTKVLCPLMIVGSCDSVITHLQTARLDNGSGGYRPFINAGLTGLTPVTMNNSSTSYCVGSPGSYQYVQAFYAVPVFSPVWLASATWTTFNGSKVVFVRGAAAFRNEPYTTASVSSGC